MDITAKIASELNIRNSQAEAAVRLIDEGNTVPFIARYRKEATGSLDDTALRLLEEKLKQYRALEQRREDVRRLIGESGNLTDEISASLDSAVTLAAIDDIYRPFRPKRRTRASVAAEAGLMPLADTMLAQDPGIDIVAESEKYISPEKGVNSSEDALRGAMDIIAERISDDPAYRGWIREYTFKNGTVVTSAKTEGDSVYSMYYDRSEPVRSIPPHRILAIDRGEKEGCLTVKIDADREYIEGWLTARLVRKQPSSSGEYVREAAFDAYSRLIAPSIRNEIRGALTEAAQKSAISVFGENLRNLLMIPPVRGMTVMGFDPAYRTGCKIAVVGPLGEVLETAVVYPTPPQCRTAEAEKTLISMINRHKVDIISIGNGTASKESEIFVSDMLTRVDRKVSYIMTNEAGASVYSASELGAKEFPQFDVSLRSAVSIARRVQDPMAELVKIDPKSIGVGQYQHDMDPKALSESLSGVVESCVSAVGADLNSASVSLLSHIAGITARTAQSIYEYRTENRLFTSRSQLRKVKGIGEKAYIQCAGFLRVPESDEVLDNTAVHPESYEAAKKLLLLLGYTDADVRGGKLGDIRTRAEEKGIERLAGEIGIGVPTLADMLTELAKPGRDPRDELPKPVLRTDAMDISSLRVGMEFTGTVRNVADFGAFVDIGVHQDGLVHISKLGKGFVRRAQDAAKVGDIIRVRVLDVDVKRGRISLERVFDKRD